MQQNAGACSEQDLPHMVTGSQPDPSGSRFARSDSDQAKAGYRVFCVELFTFFLKTNQLFVQIGTNDI